MSSKGLNEIFPNAFPGKYSTPKQTPWRFIQPSQSDNNEMVPVSFAACHSITIFGVPATAYHSYPLTATDNQICWG